MKTRHLIFVLAFLPLLAISQNISGLDEIAPFSEGLAAVRKGNQWGFINREGKLVIDFRSDLVWNEHASRDRDDAKGIAYPMFNDGRVMIKKTLDEEGIALYGFLDTQGNMVIEPEYLNVTGFKDGYAVGILLTKTFRGENTFQLRIYDYKFSEVVLNTNGDIVHLVEQRKGVQMSKKRYVLPELKAKILGKDLLAVRNEANTWDVIKAAF
jgi:hypothetical protein